MDDPKPEDGKLALAVGQLAMQVKALVPVNSPMASGGGGGAFGGMSKGDVYATAIIGLLQQIRDGIRQLVSQSAVRVLGVSVSPAAAAQVAKPTAVPPKKKGKKKGGYSWGQALRPITNYAKGTRLGRIGTKFVGQARPAFNAMGGTKALGGLGRMLGGLGGMGGGGAGAAGAGGAGAAAGAGGAAAAIGAAAAPIAIVVAAGIAFKEGADAVVSFARGCEAANRALAQVSASQAAIAAQSDVNRMGRDIDRGERTANTAAGVAEALDRWETATQPWGELLQNIENAVAGELLSLLTDLVDIARPVAEFILKRTFDQAGQNTGDTDWLEQTYRQEQARAAATARTMDRLRDQHYRR